MLHKVRLTWRRKRSNISRPEVSTAVLLTIQVFLDYMGADKSLARPGRKQANIYVSMA